MASLTAHLTETGDHGRLGFHPSCPACRQARLFGSLPAEPVISRRTQAALASGVLALSAVGPPAALAQEPDHQVEGGSGAAPDDGPEAREAPAPIPPAVPDADPAAPQTLPDDSELSEDIPVDDDPLETPSDPADPRLDSKTGTPAAPADPDPSVDTEEETPQPLPPPTQPQAPEAPAESPEPLVEAPPSALLPESTSETSAGDYLAPSPVATPQPSIPPAAPEPIVSAPAPPEPIVAASSAPAALSPPSSDNSGSSQGRKTRSGQDRARVVQPGDSLWSIAKSVLGPDASLAQIARKVSQLWNLNEDRIGTGRPDLILVGTKLKLW